MKVINILALLALSVFVKGTVTYLQPIIGLIGAAFTALNMDVHNLDIQSFEWRNWLSLDKKDETEQPENEKAGEAMAKDNDKLT